MKHWNRNKKYREDSWTTIEVQPRPSRGVWYAPPAGLNRGLGFDRKQLFNVPIVEAKIWCQQQPGNGRFFVQPYVGKWWFEFSEDALAFKLKWIGPS